MVDDDSARRADHHRGNAAQVLLERPVTLRLSVSHIIIFRTLRTNLSPFLFLYTLVIRPLQPYREWVRALPVSTLQSMSFLKRRRHAHPDQLEADDHDTNVDQDLRLRTVRTAASTIAESVASEQRAERRRSVRNKRSKFFRSKSTKSRELETPVEDKSTIQIAGKRRNIYVNMSLSAMEVDRQGDPVQRYARNKVKTTSELGLDFCIAPSHALQSTQS